GGTSLLRHLGIHHHYPAVARAGANRRDRLEGFLFPTAVSHRPGLLCFRGDHRPADPDGTRTRPVQRTAGSAAVLLKLPDCPRFAGAQLVVVRGGAILSALADHAPAAWIAQIRIGLLPITAPAFRALSELHLWPTYPKFAFESACDALAAGCLLATLRSQLWAIPAYQRI